MKEDGCKKRLHRQRQGGLRQGPRATRSSRSAEEQGIKVARQRRHGHEGARTTARSPRRSRAPARTASSSAASSQNNGVQLFKDVAAAHPGRQAVRPGRRRRVGVHRPEEGRLPATSRSTSNITVADAGPEGVPAGGAGVLQGLQGEVRQGARSPYAIYGYEAMALVLDAIKRAGDKGNDRTGRHRRALQDQGPRSRPRHVLHRRERRHDADRLRSVHRIKDGKLVFDKVIKAQTQLAIRRFCNVPPARCGRAAHLPGSRRHTSMEAASIPQPQRPAGRGARIEALDVRARSSCCCRCSAGLGIQRPDRRRQPLRTRQQRHGRALQRRDLGADRARLHARLRHHRADQLRPRRGLHDRLVRLRVAATRRSA